jgi:S-formylglutathione hydrolase FrmB
MQDCLRLKVKVMKRTRLFILLFALLVSLAAYYYYSQSRVRLETVQFRSNLMQRTLPYSVVLPPGYGLITARTTRYPVLYLLHGWSGHYSDWPSHTSLTNYAALYQLIIVTPEGDNGWYTDSATVDTDKYETYFMRELIPDVESRFRTITDRSGRAIAGLSMGGYGALKFGIKYPDQFILAASTSGAFDAPVRTDDPSIMQAFGAVDSPTRLSNDLYKLAREFPTERFTLLPYFYLDCGSDDRWFAANRELANLFLERKIAYEYRQLPGNHNWRYWDQQVREILQLAAQKFNEGKASASLK